MARKNIYLIVVVAIILVTLSTNLFCYEIYGAAGTAGTSSGGAIGGSMGGIIGDIIGGTTATIEADYYEPNSPDDASGADTVKNIGNSIIGTIQIIGSIVSVIVLIIIGIKYMIGSVEEKAEYKKAMMPYIIGAIMLFSITNIVGIIASISKVFL